LFITHDGKGGLVKSECRFLQAMVETSLRRFEAFFPGIPGLSKAQKKALPWEGKKT